MKNRAVPLVGIGIAGLVLAAAVSAVVISRDDTKISTRGSTTTSYPSYDDSTSSSFPIEDTTTVVSEVPSTAVFVAPVTVPASTTTSAPPGPVVAVDPAACVAPASQPATGAGAGPVGVFTVVLATGRVSLVGTAARLPAWRPKTGQVLSVAVAQGKPSALCLSAPDGAGAKRLNTPIGVGRPALSFDGARIAIRSTRAGGADLVVGSVEGADQKLILQSTEVGEPVWLGDSSAVVTCALSGGGRHLISVPAAGGAPKVLRDACPASPVASSPDGTRLAFTLADQVVVLDVRTKATKYLKLGTPATGVAPTWSPDGTKVAFAYSDSQGAALGVLDLQTSSGTTRGRSPGLTAPSWTLAGDFIAFTATDGAAQALFLIKPDGTGLRRVAACLTRCTVAPQAGPSDGTSVALELTDAA